MNSIQKIPFLFFFIDDLLPECFGQKKGMTFRSLLTDEPTTDKITYNGIKRSFQNLHAEFEAFDEFYNNLKKITNRNDFFQRQVIGKNKKTHTRGNNCFELVFSQDGRMDVSIIQDHGIKCVLILDVRISNHYDKSDNAVHSKNDALSSRILSALDEREIYKTKSMVESDAAFKNGLITYQNELLQSINTTEAKFEILLNTLDSLIFSNKSIEAKKSIFFDKMFEITQDLNETEQKKFEEFVEQQLTSNDTKQYHKELLQKLWYFNQYDEDEKNDLEMRFNKIRVSKTFAKSFLDQLVNISESNTPTQKNITELFKIFNKMPTSYLYVLQDELSDINIQDSEEMTDISTLTFQRQTTLLLENLIHLKTHNMKNIYPYFKQLCEEYYKGKIEPLNVETKYSAEHIKTIDDILYISMDNLSDKENVDTLAHGLMYIIIKNNPTMRLLINAPQNESILNEPDTFGHQWFNEDLNNATLLKSIDKLIFERNKRIETIICERYPFLANYISQARQNKTIPDYKLHKIYDTLKKYTTEIEFDNVYEELKKVSSHEQEILRSYFLSDLSKTPEDIDIGGYILGAFELIELEQQQKQKKKIKKEISLSQKEEEKNKNKQIRQNFVVAFNNFLLDVDNDDKKQIIKQTFDALNETIINGLKTLPKNDALGVFIRNYMQEKECSQTSFETALAPIITQSRETKKTQLFDEIKIFSSNPKQIKNHQKLEKICLSLSKNDLAYLIDICQQNPDIYSKEKIFLNMYQQHDKKDFSFFLQTVQNEYLCISAQEQEKRIAQFETTLNIVLFSSDKKAMEYLLFACQSLTQEDIKVCLSQKEMNIPAILLLQKITPVIKQKPSNASDKIKTHIETVKKMTEFQNICVQFINNNGSGKSKGLLIKKYLQLSTQDLEIFVSLNKDTQFNETFFKKLLKNKRSNPDFTQQHEGVINIVNSTIKKLKLYKTISAFINQTEEKANEKFVAQFLELTKNGYTELSEILSENKDKPLATFLLKEMKDIRKKSSTKNIKQELLEFLDDTNWLIDFYHSMKHGMIAAEEAQKTHNDLINHKTSDTNQMINNIMKLHIKSLPLSKISVILYAHLFDKDTFIHDEVIKNGFIKSVMKFKENPFGKSSQALVLAFCDELQDKHYDEIIQENGEKSSIAEFIRDLKKFSKNDSLNKVRKKLGSIKYLQHTMDFLHSKSRTR